jgi:hypothetical protein
MGTTDCEGTLIEKNCKSYWVKIYLSGPIEQAKQILRENVLREGLCVTIDPTLFIYTGGEEFGFVVGLINYPRFPTNQENIWNRAEKLAMLLLEGTCQHSVLIMSPDHTKWITKRNE